MYGQSRSVAVVAGYLLSLGVSFDGAIHLLKEKRQVVCINPGFLAQLYLLSLKGFHAPEVQLIVQSPLRYSASKSSAASSINEEESVSRLHKSTYVDSYKAVSGGKKRLLESTGIGGDPDSDSSAPADILRDSDLNLAHSTDTASEGTVKNIADCRTADEVVTCLSCGYVLAREANIVRGTPYADFLKEHTNDYWVGYRAIHPFSDRVVALESSEAGDKTHIKHKRDIKVRGNSRGSSALKSRAGTGSGAADMSIVGPMDWIAQQINGRRKEIGVRALLQPAGSANPSSAAASESVASDLKLVCPGCRSTCGYCVKGGLEICQSFLRCDLLALSSATTKRTQLTKSNPVAESLHDSELQNSSEKAS